MLNNVEAVLIGALLINDKLAPYAIPDLEIEHFEPDYQKAFAAVKGSWDRDGKIDAVKVMERYPTEKQMMLDCIQACESEFVKLTPERAEEWARLIQEKSALSRFQSLAMESASQETTFQDLPDLFQRMGEALNLHSEKNDFFSVSDLIDGYIMHLNEKPRYIRTGLALLDKYLHLSPGNLLVIGGRPSSGKTALSLQIAAGMAKQGYRVCYFSLETDPETLAARIIANQIYVPLSAVKSKSVSVNELDRLAEVKKLPLFIRSASGKGTAWMKAQALRMKADVVFVDYLQIIHDFSGKDRFAQITSISIALHELAQSTGILVVALAQLNRNAARIEPTNADLRESGQIEQDSDAIILLSSDGDKYLFRLSKNKEGMVCDLPIEFDKTIQRFKEGAW